MAISPDEYRLVFQERARDRMRGAEQWRLAQSVSRSDGKRSDSRGPALALRRLVRSLMASRVDEKPRQAGTTVSRQTQ